MRFTLSALLLAATALATPAPEPQDPANFAGQPQVCEYGKWRCHHHTVQVCNYVSNPPATLGWVVVGQCPNHCEFNAQGNALCW